MLWLLFRLNVESGWAKWLGGDPHWHDLTAMVSYYETAPLPTWIGWWVHQLPVWAHQACTLFSLVVEGLVPLMLLGTRRLRLLAFGLMIAMQTSSSSRPTTASSTCSPCALCLWALDDGHLRAVAARLRLPAPAERPAVARPAWAALPALLAVVFLGTLAATPFRRYWQADDEPGPPTAWARLEERVAPFDTLNVYQLFVNLTLARDEIVIEGSRDGANWTPYVFRHKPGELSRAPDFVAPHQPRLDFQFWFLCLDGPPRDPWFHALLTAPRHRSRAHGHALREHALRRRGAGIRALLGLALPLQLDRGTPPHRRLVDARAAGPVERDDGREPRVEGRRSAASAQAVEQDSKAAKPDAPR